jgi:hypothetical protein
MVSDPPTSPNDNLEQPGGQLPINSGNDTAVADAVAVALNAWAVSVPDGKIKFNLARLDERNSNGRVRHVISLKELKYVSRSPILQPRTRYFKYQPPTAIELNQAEASVEIERLRPLMKKV